MMRVPADIPGVSSRRAQPDLTFARVTGRFPTRVGVWRRPPGRSSGWHGRFAWARWPLGPGRWARSGDGHVPSSEREGPPLVDAKRIVGALLSLLLLLPGVAQAQVPRDLPAAITQSPGSLSPDQERQVREFVAIHMADLASDDPIAIRRARQAIQRQVAIDSVRQPTPSFRFALSTAIVADLERLLASDRPVHRINALHLAGEIATERTTQLPLSTLGDADPSVRYASAYALGLTFQAIQRSAPAVRNVPQLIDAIARRLAEEEDPFVLDRLILTMRTVAVAGSDGLLGEHRVSAIDAISTRIGQRLRSLPPGEDSIERLRVLLRAVEVVQSAFTRGPFTERAGADRDPSVVLAAGMGGDAMVYVARRLGAGVSSPAERDLLSRIAATGEATIFFAQGAHSTTRTTPAPRSVAEAVAKGNDRKYRDDLASVYTSEQGLLVRPPFSLEAGRFRF